MELFQRIDLESSQKCYEKGRIRAVVLDEWELLVDACDHDGKLHLLDTRKEDTSVAKSSSLDYGDSSDTDNSEIDLLSINDENGLFFRPDWSSMCITNSHIPEHPSNKGHQNVLHASLACSGDLIIVPASSSNVKHWLGICATSVKRNKWFARFAVTYQFNCPEHTESANVSN